MITIHRAQWLFDAPSSSELRQFERAALVVNNEGGVLAVGKAAALMKSYPKAKIVDHGDDTVITPGFVDGHVHAPQLEMMASAGYSLLEWLDKFTFPTEAKYSNKFYAARRWKEFCDGLLRCGTTSAAVFATSHTAATEGLLKAGEQAGLRLHVGKVLMDRNAPENLLQDADTALEELDELILRWKKYKRTRVSMAVRFAPTSTPALLKGAGELLQKHPNLLLQTHLAETQDEIKWVKELFPQVKDYTSVYAQHGLVGDRSLLGHCIYLEDGEVEILKKNRAHLIHCPSSNFFLGSGLFNYSRLMKKGLSIALGSDVGAGWDLSLQSTARCCYEAQALQKYFMKSSELLYLATRAGAIALGEGKDLGLLEAGYRADFLVHNLRGRSLVYQRAERSQSADELMSALLFLGGESTLQATYVQGECLFKKKIPKHQF
jgi:guanine deaminase